MYKLIHSSIHGSYECTSVRPSLGSLTQTSGRYGNLPDSGYLGSASLRYACRTTWGCIGEVAALEHCKLVLDVKENGVLQRIKGRDVVTETGFTRSLWLQLPINMFKIMPLKRGPNIWFCFLIFDLLFLYQIIW